MSETAEKLKDLTTINFSITKCPIKVFKGFSEFCKSETNDNYAFGLKMLLESRETNIKEVILFEKYTELRDEVEQLKLKQKSERKAPKTMGSSRQNEVNEDE